MTDQPKLKIAQIGVANFGAARRRTMRQAGLFDLVASYDWNEAAMKQAQEQDGAKPCASYDELLDTPDIDAVVIATGAKFHAEQTIAALQRGYHVFVEKPLCSTQAEMEAMLAAQKESGKVVQLGHHDHSCDAISGTMKAAIDAGDIGAVATFDATTSHNGGLMIKPGDWRGDPLKNPGGMLFQCGVHKLHELMYLFGPVTEVACLMRNDINPDTGTADIAICHLRFASGLLGTLNAYHVSPYYHTINIFGTKANLYLDYRYFDEGTSLLMQTSHFDGKKEPKVPVPMTMETDSLGEVKAFYRACRSGQLQYPSIVDGARAVAVVFAAEESAKQGGIPVAVSAV